MKVSTPNILLRAFRLIGATEGEQSAEMEVKDGEPCYHCILTMHRGMEGVRCLCRTLTEDWHSDWFASHRGMREAQAALIAILGWKYKVRGLRITQSTEEHEEFYTDKSRLVVEFWLHYDSSVLEEEDNQ